jgi:hypothetical protein
MQKAASAVDADTSFRAAARTSPGAVSDLQRAELEHPVIRGACNRVANDPAGAEVNGDAELAPRMDDQQ